MGKISTDDTEFESVTGSDGRIRRYFRASGSALLAVIDARRRCGYVPVFRPFAGVPGRYAFTFLPADDCAHVGEVSVRGVTIQNFLPIDRERQNG